MPEAKKSIDYQALQSELETIMLQLQGDDMDIDDALKQYQSGLEIVEQLDAYLKTAENKVTQLKAKFNLDK